MFVIIKNPFTQEVTKTEFFGRLVMKPGDFISVFPGEEEELIELIESKKFEGLFPINVAPALSASVVPFNFITREKKLTYFMPYFLGPQPMECTVIVYPFYEYYSLRFNSYTSYQAKYAEVEMEFVLEPKNYALAKVSISADHDPKYLRIISPGERYIICNKMEEGTVITYTPGEFEDVVSKYALKDAITAKTMPTSGSQRIYYAGQELVSMINYRETQLGFVAWFKLKRFLQPTIEL
ncbi:MAG: hypothetical protein ABDH29_04175 [Aquificaceae bacterium]